MSYRRWSKPSGCVPNCYFPEFSWRILMAWQDRTRRSPALCPLEEQQAESTVTDMLSNERRPIDRRLSLQRRPHSPGNELIVAVAKLFAEGLSAAGDLQERIEDAPAHLLNRFTFHDRTGIDVHVFGHPVKRF